MNLLMRKRLIAGILAGCWLSCAAITASASNLQLDCGALIIDAQYQDTGVKALPVLKATLSTALNQQTDRINEWLTPWLFGESIELNLLVEQWAGESLYAKYYCAAEGQQEGYVNMVYYDGTVGGSRDDKAVYIDGIEPYYLVSSYKNPRLACAELDFMPADEAQRLAQTVINGIGFEQESILYQADAYSLTPGEGRRVYGNAADYAAALMQTGAECYVFTYRFQYMGIPLASFKQYFPTMDSFTVGPCIQVIWNQRGLVSLWAHEVLEISEVSQPYSLIALDQAIETVAQRRSEYLGMGPAYCKEVALEYLPLPYVGGAVERDAQIVPAWAFYWTDDPSDTATFNIWYVNAINGQIVE